MSQTVELKVAMSCEGCVGAVKRVLGKMEGVESFDEDLKEQKVTVKGTWNLEQFSRLYPSQERRLHSGNLKLSLLVDKLNSKSFGALTEKISKIEKLHKGKI